MTHDWAPLLVLGAGQRCGTTLVQRLLCSHPRVRIWGEHAGQLRPVLTAVARLREWSDANGRVGRIELQNNGYQGFLANITPDRAAIDDACRSFIDGLFGAPARQEGRPVWGFKEVRYGLSEALSLAELFPGLRVVLVVRDPRDVLRSLDEWEQLAGWDRSRTIGALGHWRDVASSFASDGRQLGERLLRLRYEDLIADPDSWTTRLAAHCGLDAALLDPSVFGIRVHRPGPPGRVARELRPWTALPANLRAILADGAFQAVAEAYGYSL